MNTERLHELLPDPKTVGQSEYWAIHQVLIDGAECWAEDNPEADVSGLVLSMLSEMSQWVDKLTEQIAEEIYDHR